jgi:4-hydroxy-3-polyprenylbenzoate decarboxylase
LRSHLPQARLLSIISPAGPWLKYRGHLDHISDNLLIRAADVALKERRRLVLVVRETPLHQGHLKSLLEVTQSGGIVMPPVPACYGRPQTIADLVDQTVGRVLDLFGIDNALVQRWRPSP